MAVNVLSLCHVREISPGTHTFFPTYTCPVYCWRSVQLLDFDLLGNLIHASQPIRTTFTGQWFASGFLQTPPHGDALAIGCTLPTAGRVRDFHPLERAPAGRTQTGGLPYGSPPFFCYFLLAFFSVYATLKVTRAQKDSVHRLFLWGKRVAFLNFFSGGTASPALRQLRCTAGMEMPASSLPAGSAHLRCLRYHLFVSFCAPDFWC